MGFKPAGVFSPDMFLKIEGARSGVFKGESRDPQHVDEIHVEAWSWGMEGNASATITAGGRSGGSNQVSVHEMEIFKRVDGATPALMSALRGNEVISKATLSVRKAGGVSPVEYLKIIMEKARIRAINLDAGVSGSVEGPPENVVERVLIGFQKITVEYRPQQSQGGGGGVSSFSMEFDQA